MASAHALLPILALGLVVACARPPDPPLPARAADFRPAEIRRPAVAVRLTLDPGTFDERERAALAAEYEGALLEGLDAKAVLARDVRIAAGPGLDRGAVLARAREVQADHAIIVEATVARAVAEFCREARRAPLRAPATIWRQRVEVIRLSDGARRLGIPEIATTDVEADCENPRESRRRSPAEAVAHAVEALLSRLLGP